MLSIFIWIHFFSHILINYKCLHNWSFSSSHVICSSCILTYMLMIMWTCASEIKCDTCFFLHISCKPSFNHGLFTTLVYNVCIQFSSWLDLFHYLTWGFDQMGFTQKYFWYPPNTTHNQLMALMVKHWPNARVLSQIMNHLGILTLITYKLSTQLQLSNGSACPWWLFMFDVIITYCM